MPKPKVDRPVFIGVRVSKDQAVAVRSAAKRQRVTVSEVVRLALDRLTTAHASNPQ